MITTHHGDYQRRDYTMIYGYCRVSTKGQEAHGNGLDVQRRAVQAAGAQDIRCEAFTGTTMERPEWTRLVDEVQAGDTIIVAKLDRIARTSSGGFEAVKSLLSRGVAVHILNMGRIDDTPTGRLILSIMFAFAEFDRDMVVERMAAGREAARKRPGYKDGRKPLQIDQMALTQEVDNYLHGNVSTRAAAKSLGISERTFRRRRDEICKKIAV